MRRFHVHVAVQDIAKSTSFYSKLFGSPARIEPDYVKWMVEDPRLNFAISSRGRALGVNHLGLQMDSDEELRELRSQLETADVVGDSETARDCCYATSDKYWVTDPQGVAWETYHTLSSIPTFDGKETSSCGTSTQSSCCASGATEQRSQPNSSKGCCA